MTQDSKSQNGDSSPEIKHLALGQSDHESRIRTVEKWMYEMDVKMSELVDKVAELIDVVQQINLQKVKFIAIAGTVLFFMTAIPNAVYAIIRIFGIF